MTVNQSPRGNTSRNTNPWQLAALLALTTLAASSNRTFGLGFTIPNQDASAIARGNAFIATANNPSAIFYNPAAITQLEGQEFQFGAHNLAINSEYRSLDGSTHAETKDEIATVPQLYYTVSPENKPIAFGIGVYAPYGLGLEWPRDTSFSSLALEGRLNYMSFNPVIAWKVLPSLSIAAGPTINYATIKLIQGIGFSPGDQFRFDGDGWDAGVTAGLLWKPRDQWAFGVNYRGPTAINFEGTSSTKPYAPGEKTSGKVDFPQWLGAGIGYLPSDHWNFEVYAIWTDWDQLDAPVFKKASGDTPFALNWESSFMTGIGGTRSFDSGWFVSAGYFFSQNSTSEKHFNPIVPDTDLHVGSAGFGYKGERWRFTLAGQVITGPWRTVDQSVSPSLVGESANGRYRWFNQSVNFSVGYHF